MINQKVILLLIAIAAVCCTSADNTDQGVLLTQAVDNIIALNLKSTEKCVQAIAEYQIKVYTEFHESAEACTKRKTQCYNEDNIDYWSCYLNWNSCSEPFDAIRSQKIQQLQDIINRNFPLLENAKNYYAGNAEYCLSNLKACFKTLNVNCYGIYQGCTDYSANNYVSMTNSISNSMLDAINSLSK